MKPTLLERAQQQGTPLIDGETVTFVWSGAKAPLLAADFTDWEDKPVAMQRAGKGVWTYTIQLPVDGYIEYAFFLNGKRVPDPYNPRLVNNGVGSVNHFFNMPAYQPNRWIRPRRATPKGTVTRVDVEGSEMIVGKTRPVYFYQPPVEQPVPLVVVYDGQDYLRRAHLTTMVDNLVAEGRMHPVALAMVASSGPTRFLEYACSEATVGWLDYRVIPEALQHLNLLPAEAVEGGYGVLGASMGGVMALYTALRRPGRFGRVLSQSGAFSLNEVDLVVWDLLPTAPALQVWMDAGRFEWLLDTNRRMQARLIELDRRVTYQEYAGGHNYRAWRDELPAGLTHLFPA